MKILGSRFLAIMVCVNVAMGALAICTYGLAKHTYWTSPVEKPDNGFIEVVNGASQSGEITMKCFEGFGATLTNFLVLAEYETNKISFVCENLTPTGFTGVCRYSLAAGSLKAEWTGDTEGNYYFSHVGVADEQLYPLPKGVKILPFPRSRSLMVTTTNVTTKVGD